MLQKIGFIIAFFFFIIHQNSARHIVGGDVQYECLSIDTINGTSTYLITFSMYRDAAAANAAGFDNDATFGVFVGNESSGSFFRGVNNIPVQDISRITEVGSNPCIIVPPGVRVEKGIYRFELTLPILEDESYMIAYQRCCRNVTINNIVRPEEKGAAFTVEISPTSQISCNNSPVFNLFPPIVICLGEEVNFDHGATDAEGDQLVYEFCAPLTAGGQDGVNGGDPNSCTGVRPDPNRCLPPFEEVQFVLPRFSSVNPLGGSPQITINPTTGRINGIPNVEGQFVVGVCVKEFRDGELIGAIRRDFQFNVAPCEQTVVADIAATADLGPQMHEVVSCGETTIDFVNESFEEANIISYEWNFNIDGEDVIKTSRDASYAFPGLGFYTGTMIINKNTECADTASIEVNIFPDIEADFSFSYDTCVSGPVQFIDLSSSGAGPIVNWEWTFQDSLTADIQFAEHQFSTPGEKAVTLVVEDSNQCSDTIVSSILWQPAPSTIIVEPTSFIGCAPANILFNNLTSPIDSTYLIEWDFGDGSDGSGEISPFHVFNEEGRYDVSIEITTPIGCTTSTIFRDWILIEPKPTAGFTFTPETPSSFNKELTFTDVSEGATGYQYIFDDLGVSFDSDPIFLFPDTGIYVVQQVVVNEYSCTDTMTAIIDIAPTTNIIMPTAFTPNNDALNDVFIGLGLNDGVSDYEFNIFNRWGEKVFGTDDTSIGWNGKKNNSGRESPSGVYVFVIDYITSRGKNEQIKGHVTLVR